MVLVVAGSQAIAYLSNFGISMTNPQRSSVIVNAAKCSISTATASAQILRFLRWELLALRATPRPQDDNLPVRSPSRNWKRIGFRCSKRLAAGGRVLFCHTYVSMWLRAAGTKGRCGC